MGTKKIACRYRENEWRQNGHSAAAPADKSQMQTRFHSLRRQAIGPNLPHH
jgi:hypothetical protein